MLDFADESLEFEQSAAVVGHLPIIPKSVTGISYEAEVNYGTVLSTNVTAEVVKSSSSLQQPKSAVSFKVPQSSRSDKPRDIAILSLMDWRFTNTAIRFDKYKQPETLVLRSFYSRLSFEITSK